VRLHTDDTLDHAAAVLDNLHHLASAPAHDADDAVVGVVSESDLLRGCSPLPPAGSPAPRRRRPRRRPRLRGRRDDPRALVVCPGDDLAAAGRLLVDLPGSGPGSWCRSRKAWRACTRPPTPASARGQRMVAVLARTVPGVVGVVGSFTTPMRSASTPPRRRTRL